MPPIRIDFYLLADDPKQSTWLFACRLLEKIYLRGSRVFVFCSNQEETTLLDELLWTFKEDSFIPHNLQGEGPEPPPPIQIGYQNKPKGFSEILLNLSSTIPPFYSDFKRIIELVPNNPESKAISRANYRFYRSNNCELFTHNL